tara:strand:- start:2665 stop:3129 length:465 start_codon:yes stop_codon:yes gene_type:complete
LSHLVATFFYIGHLRPAPGTWGSLAALLLGFTIIQTTGVFGLCIAIITICVLGWWATAAETKGKENHDPSEIVIDEVAGQWITILPLAIYPQPYEINIWYWLLAFAGFRLFDITKPGLVGWADRQIGPTGVMLDDIIAGLMAAAVISLVMVSLS